MMHYPSKEQVANAIDAVRARGERVTDVAVAIEIGARCGLTPGADIVGLLVREFDLTDRFLHGPAQGERASDDLTDGTR